jgi:hypothetical protein
MGGFYERLVRNIKQCMRKSVGKLCLSLSQLQTVVTEVEFILNSRPLVYVGSELSGEVLTLAHFLSLNIGDRIVGKISSGETDYPEYLTHVSSARNLLVVKKRTETCGPFLETRTVVRRPVRASAEAARTWLRSICND